MVLHVIACKLGFSISVLGAGSPQPEDGAQDEGCISSRAHPPPFFLLPTTEQTVGGES